MNRLLSRRSSQLAEAATLLAATRFVLWLSPRLGAAKLLKRAHGGGEAPNGRGREQAAQVASAVERVAPWVAGSTCLGRALTGWLMLRRRRVPAVVRVGARAESTGEMRMHAWLQVGADVVIGRDESERFVPLSPR